MKRLTAWDNGDAYYPKCFEEPCSGIRCSNGQCEYEYEQCKRLAEYEDTGLTPEEITDGKLLTGWIPVTERLPEYDGMYLACFDDEFVTAVAYETSMDGTQDWELWADSGEVVAWMQLPEPYREDEA